MLIKEEYNYIVTTLLEPFDMDRVHYHTDAMFDAYIKKGKGCLISDVKSEILTVA